ncbi:MAG: hypothetical protein OXH15_16330 [Gammaproteobacteria bacterium]|nr:hypothetical protein [Gammaproteobacteria bacterium]
MNDQQQDVVYERKRNSHRSYRNIRDAARQRQQLPHEPFGTAKVEASSLSVADSIRADANVSYRAIESWAAAAMAT